MNLRKELANLIFPKINRTIDDLEKEYQDKGADDSALYFRNSDTNKCIEITFSQ